MIRFTEVVAAGIAALGLSLIPGTAQDDDKPAEPAADEPIKDIHAVVKTNKGDIKLVIFAEKAPVTAASFLNLAKRDYYNGILFHRVVPGFVIQVGDPLTLDPKRESDWGKGGPGYFIELEVDDSLTHHSVGVLSMARKSVPVDSAGSQFFITLDKTPHLDGQYAIFGEVTEGIDIVKSIEKGDKIESIEVTDSTDALFTKLEKRVAEWNKKLDLRARAQKAAEAGEDQ